MYSSRSIIIINDQVVNVKTQKDRYNVREHSPFKVTVQIMVLSPFILGVQFGSFSGTLVRNSVLAVFSFNFFFLSGIFSLSPVWFWQSVPVQYRVSVQCS
jgi:hypothetical protein